MTEKQQQAITKNDPGHDSADSGVDASLAITIADIWNVVTSETAKFTCDYFQHFLYQSSSMHCDGINYEQLTWKIWIAKK